MVPHNRSDFNTQRFLELMRRLVRNATLVPIVFTLLIPPPALIGGAWLLYLYNLDIESARYLRQFEHPVRSIVLAKDASVVDPKILTGLMHSSNIHSIKITDMRNTVWVDLESPDKSPIFSHLIEFDVTNPVVDYLSQSPESNRDFLSQVKVDNQDKSIAIAHVFLLVDTSLYASFLINFIIVVIAVTFFAIMLAMLFSNRIHKALKKLTHLMFNSLVQFTEGNYRHQPYQPNDPDEIIEAKKIINYVGQLLESYDQTNLQSLNKAIQTRNEALKSRKELEHHKYLTEKHTTRLIRDLQEPITRSISALEHIEFHLKLHPTLCKSARSVIEILSPLPPLCNALSSIGEMSTLEKSLNFSTICFGELYTDIYDMARSSGMEVITDLPPALESPTLLIDQFSATFWVGELLEVYKNLMAPTIFLSAKSNHPESIELSFAADLVQPLGDEVVCRIARLSTRFAQMEITQGVESSRDNLTLRLTIPRLPSKAFTQCQQRFSVFKVLVINQSPRIHSTIAASLETHHIECRFADSLQEALHELQYSHFHAVLLEPVLSGHNGFAICKILRSRNLLSPDGKSTLLVGLVLMKTQDIEDLAEASGMTFVIEKSHDFMELGKTLAAAMSADYLPAYLSGKQLR